MHYSRKTDWGLKECFMQRMVTDVSNIAVYRGWADWLMGNVSLISPQSSLRSSIPKKSIGALLPLFLTDINITEVTENIHWLFLFSHGGAFPPYVDGFWVFSRLTVILISVMPIWQRSLFAIVIIGEDYIIR